MWQISVLPSRESGLPPVDVVVVAQPGGTVADLAQALGRHLAPSSAALLAPHSDGAPWPPSQLISESGLRSGDVLDVATVPRSWLAQPARRRTPTAVVRVVAGPDAGTEVEVHGESLTIGRDAGCTVTLTDPMVSRRHAGIRLRGGAVLVDEGSAHGTVVAGEQVTRARGIEPGEVIEIGDTRLVLEHRGADARREVAVLRPPRFGDALLPAELDLPQPPARPRPQPFPWTMILMPMVMGGTMFLVTRRAYSLIFMAAWPLMMLFGWQLQRRTARREHAEEVAAWQQSLQEVMDQLDESAHVQRARAEDDDPDIDAVIARIASRDRSVWTRRQTDPDFLAVRMGRGAVPAVVTSGSPRSGGTADRTHLATMTELAATRAVLPDMPVPLALGAHGLSAITGPAAAVDAAVRALVLRLAATHSPADVSLAAVLGRERGHVESWLRWLPHTARRSGGVAPVVVGPGPGQDLLELVASVDGVAGAVGHTVCLLDESAGVPRRVVEAVVEAAEASQLHLVWIGSDPDRVPAGTGVVVDLTGRLHGRSRLVDATDQAPEAMLAGRDRGGLTPVRTLDQLDLRTAWRAARTMTSFHDEAATTVAEGALPDSVRLPELGADLADADGADAVLGRWGASRGLRAQIGAGADGVVTVDLREDGPHTLVAGTTGSGKSELLQTLICSLAMNNPPSRVTFLLVDYKGGAAFRECADLPHSVGYITDLTPALVQRALTSMHAELTTREHLLAEHGAKDLISLEREHPEVCPPSMVICVDEFAALLAEVPEFVEGMVSIAQRGRSLGMHMVLATQRPAGVVTPQIKANTDLRIALRVASTDDSGDVIEAPDAAHLSRRTPGRAWLRRTGHGTRELVQVAWVGAREQLREDGDRVEVRPFTAAAVPELRTAGERFHPRSDLDRLVRTAGTAFARSGLDRPRRPWLPPLPDELALACREAGVLLLGADALDESLVPGTGADVREVRPEDGRVLIGMVDRPAAQQQEPVHADLARSGHLLVHGASGSGKTELLRTLAVAATAGASDPAPYVYGIDCGGGGLGVLEGLPSVGSIVVEQEQERILRMLRMLHRTVADRNAMLAAHRAADLEVLRSAGVAAPRIYLLVDNLPSLVEGLEQASAVKRGHLDRLLAVLQDGRRCGVHVVATSPRRSGVPSAMQAAFGQRLVLRMSSDDDYGMLGVPMRVLDAESAPGRALLGSSQVQLATLGGAGGPAQVERVVEVAALVAPLYAGRAAVPVPGMPAQVPVSLLPAALRDDLCLGVDAEFAGAVTVPLLEAPLLIAGRARSGRTSALRGIAELARRSEQPPQRVLVMGPGAEGTAGPGDDVVTDLAEAARIARELLEAPVPGEGWQLVLLDDAHEWERLHDAGGTARDDLGALADLAAAAPARRLALVVATDPDEARAKGHITSVVPVVRRSRRAVLLAPEMSDGALVGATVPMTTLEPLTGPGRGLLATPGQVRVIQLLCGAAETGVGA